MNLKQKINNKQGQVTLPPPPPPSPSLSFVPLSLLPSSLPFICLFVSFFLLDPLQITDQPQTIVHAPHGGILKLYCDAVGNPPPKFQWFKEDTPIPGAMDREYEKHNVTQDDNGMYRCQVYNDGESVMSVEAHVFVEKGNLCLYFCCCFWWLSKANSQSVSQHRLVHGGVASDTCSSSRSGPGAFSAHLKRNTINSLLMNTSLKQTPQ